MNRSGQWRWGGYDPTPMLIGREAEKQALDHLLARVRQGLSGSLVLRGEAGIGKTALLEYAIASAGDMQVARVVGVESEIELGFAGLHQLLLPFLPELDRLPAPQRQARWPVLAQLSVFSASTGWPQ